MTTVYEHKTELAGDDYQGLPTTPVRYRGAPKPIGIDWAKVTADYTIGRRYTNGESLSELSRDYSVAVNTIVKTLKVLKVPTRSPAEAGRLRRQQGKS